jgi:uncharacterized protein (UPF0332 family)
MSRKGKKTIAYRWQKAQTTLQEAMLLAQQDFWDACINKLYYACFYAVSALLLKHQKDAYTHKGVRSLFNEYFVKTNLLGTEDGYFYAQLFDKRQKADYADFVQYTEEEVAPLITQTQTFLDTLKKLIQP